MCPKGINLIRKGLVKEEYIRTGGNGYKALKAGGLSENTARHCVEKGNTLLNIVKAEIKEELNDRELIDKAYKTLQKNLSAEKKSDQNTAAQAILKFKVGEISNINNANPDKIIIAYGNKEAKESRLPQDIVVDEVKDKSSSLLS